jgi:shikimate dehydrogenase
MASSKDIAALQECVENNLDSSAVGDKRIAGVIGDAPSRYSKSPRLWNAAFRHLGINATYLPFDVDNVHLGKLLAVLKNSDRFMGINVTVPHKVRVMDYLDELDPGAARIRAVNTIVRNPSGRLIGYNTDGEGFIDSIILPQPNRKESFIASLKGMNILLLGAGGSARAVALHVANLLDGGVLVICNRTFEHAVALAADVQEAGGHALAIGEDALQGQTSNAGLIINCTTKGQGGVRKLPGGTAFMIEPYSALAPAHPPAFAESAFNDTDFAATWRAAAARDIDANNLISMALARCIPSTARFYDLIYHPEETTFLRHGRITGHPTMNGKAMIINQAVIAFCKRICRAKLQARGIDTPETSKQILDVMYGAW